MKCKYIKSELVEAVENSASFAEIFRYLNQDPRKNSYEVLNRALNFYNIDLSPLEENRSKTKVIRVKRSIDELEGAESEGRLSNTKLKRILDFYGEECKCSYCGLKEWNNQPISLDIDHIDGNCFNNKVENLHYLCPNCHRQKTSSERKSKKKDKKLKFCDCGRTIYSLSVLCSLCFQQKETVDWPTKEKLLELVWTFPMTKIAEMLSCSDVAIKKKCQRESIPVPGRKYWRNKYLGNEERCEELKRVALG